MVGAARGLSGLYTAGRYNKRYVCVSIFIAKYVINNLNNDLLMELDLIKVDTLVRRASGEIEA